MAVCGAHRRIFSGTEGAFGVSSDWVADVYCEHLAERISGNRPLARCRTPRSSWTVKRLGDRKITGAQLWAMSNWAKEVTPFAETFALCSELLSVPTSALARIRRRSQPPCFPFATAAWPS